MNNLKKSFVSIALSSILLFSSVMPVMAQNVPAAHPARIHKLAKKPVVPASVAQKPANKPFVTESKLAESKKRKLTWTQKLRKKIRTIKDEISEFVGEYPVATIASVIVSAIGMYLVWKNVTHNPWIRVPNVVGNSACDVQQAIVPQNEVREITHHPWIRVPNVVGNSACDVQQAIVPQNEVREITHHLFEREPQIDPIATAARGENVWVDGVAQHREVNARFRLNNPAQIMQLRSANQEAQGGACAYHAAKNCMVILNALANPNANDLQLQLEGQDLCEQLFGFQNGVWRRMILDGQYIRNGDCMRGGDWLSGHAVQDIVNRELARRELLAANVNAPITVIENADAIAHPQHNDPMFNATQVARDGLAAAVAANQPYTHGFIFNVARGRIVAGQPVAPRREGGHWLAAVLHRNAAGEIRWYNANSSFQRAILESPTLRDLIAAVQGAGVQVPVQPQA